MRFLLARVYSRAAGILLLATVSLLSFGARAEIMRSPSSNSPVSMRPPFQAPRIAAPSGYVFAGTVISVRLIPAVERGRVAVVEVTFHVDQGMRGVHTGQTLAIREWAGLWHAGERYRPGERVFLFLYQPSKLGLTSPVGGALGRFGIDDGGQAVLTPAQIGILQKNRNLGMKLHGAVRINPAALFRLMRSGEREP